MLRHFWKKTKAVAPFKAAPPADSQEEKKTKERVNLVFRHPDSSDNKCLQCSKPSFIGKRGWEHLNYTQAENKNLWWSYCQLLQRRQTKQLQSWSLCIFHSTTVPTFTAIFHFSYLLHPEGHRGARQEGSAGLQRKSLALLLNSPGSAALSRVSGYRLLAPASSCNFSVVEKRDSSFSESPSAISRQCRGRQCLRNPRGHFKETVWNKEDEDTKEIFPGLQCDSRSVFFNTEQVQYFYWERTRVPHFTI